MSGLVKNTNYQPPIQTGGGLTSQNYINQLSTGYSDTTPGKVGYDTGNGPELTTTRIHNTTEPFKRPEPIMAKTPDYDQPAMTRDFGHAPDYAAGEHGTDVYKQPHHITFSTHSELSDPRDPSKAGGTWGQYPQADGNVHWGFQPSAHNYRQHSPEKYADYFKNQETTKAFVILPNGEKVYGTR